MTNREAIKIIHTERECVKRNWKENCDRNCGECDLLMDEEQITEAYDMAIAALEKQEPIKPRLNYKPLKVARKLFSGENNYTCTHCGNICLKRCSATRSETFYCWNCGQKLDWTEDAE